MASGMDSARVTDILNVTMGQSALAGGTAVLVHGFNAGASNQGHVRLITTTTPSSSTVNGSELSGGSYVQGTGIVYTTGASGSFGAASYGATSGTISNTAVLQQTGMPGPVTIGGIEIWDSAGTPLRWWWGTLASNVTTNSGDTLSFAASAITGTLNA